MTTDLENNVIDRTCEVQSGGFSSLDPFSFSFVQGIFPGQKKLITLTFMPSLYSSWHLYESREGISCKYAVNNATRYFDVQQYTVASRP